MGMFDRVWVSCPKCGAQVEFQSKAGECILKDYTLNDVPPEIREDIVGEMEFCENCEEVVTIQYGTGLQAVID